MEKNFLNKREIVYDYLNEISIKELIYAIDKSIDYSLYEINEDESNSEKNILIKLNKNKITKERGKHSAI